MSTVNLAVDLGSLKLKNPIGVASGTFGYGAEISPFVDLGHIGAVFTKGVAPTPWEGNKPPRIAETPSGMLNAIGLQNVGVEAFLEEKLPFLREKNATVIVNIVGRSFEDYIHVAQKLSGVPGIHGLELNVSCPNVKEGCIAFGTDKAQLKKLTAEVKAATTLPLFVKLSPNVTSIVAMAEGAVEGGADGLTLINTLIGTAINWRSRRPLIRNVTAGLSGPAIKPVALRMVYQVAEAFPKIPIVGIGGIQNADDVLEFIVAGAWAVQIGTMNFVDPTISERILADLTAALESEKITDINSLRRSLQCEKN